MTRLNGYLRSAPWERLRDWASEARTSAAGAYREMTDSTRDLVRWTARSCQTFVRSDLYALLRFPLGHSSRP